MALTDHKIPILTGVNDVPSVEGELNHPNDSLLCDKYNSLIDNLVTEIPLQAKSAISVTGNGGSYDSNTGIITLTGGGQIPNTYLNADAAGTYQSLWIKVSQATGSDTTGDGDIIPYQTLDKAKEVLATVKPHGTITIQLLDGEYVNPNLDFTGFKFIKSINANRSVSVIEIRGEFTSVIVFDNNFFDLDDNHTQLIRSNCPIEFNECFIKFTDYAVLSLDRQDVAFRDCYFDLSLVNNTNQYKILLNKSIFKIYTKFRIEDPDNSVTRLITAHYSMIILDYFIQDLKGISIILNGSWNTVWNLTPNDMTGSLNLSNSVIYRKSSYGLTHNTSNSIIHTLT